MSTGLTPGNYYLQFVPPSGFDFTSPDQGGDDAKDSDADRSTGKTPITTLVSGENDTSWDAGLVRGTPTAVTLASLAARSGGGPWPQGAIALLITGLALIGGAGLIRRHR